MSGPFEKYADQATQAFCIARWGETATGLADADDVEFYREGVAAAVEAVGPLIVEDTRERIVAAAGRALELDASPKPDGLYYCATSGEIERYPGGGFDVCCELGPAGHEPISEIAFSAVRKEFATEIIARLTKRRSEITPGRPGWVYFTEAIDMVNAAALDREKAQTEPTPKWSDLFGIDPDFTGKACSVDYVRWQRGAETPVEFEHEVCWAFLLNDGKPLS